MQTLLSKYWLLIVAIWYAANGILHDIFVIKGHKGGYDRDLLRLLMDGHVLILSGAVTFVCYFMALNNISYGAVIAIIVAIAMLVYCFMIMPFLKSLVTIVLSLILLAVSIKLLLAKQ